MGIIFKAKIVGGVLLLGGLGIALMLAAKGASDVYEEWS